MAGATANSVPATGVNVGANRTSASYVSSVRISAAANLFATLLCNQPQIDVQEIVQLCLSLARGNHLSTYGNSEMNCAF
ncbi:hypothetical protein H5410_039936 [Solanum commersonii]|uniref:Uncharacterized protein n=1 Tax=Solanum commersonii TaxID=4109 RepID=A0A9J5XR30_SOLCO|nr:hypothetical protein H5410_039936 [Solanum commersonii]